MKFTEPLNFKTPVIYVIVYTVVILFLVPLGLSSHTSTNCRLPGPASKPIIDCDAITMGWVWLIIFFTISHSHFADTKKLAQLIPSLADFPQVTISSLDRYIYKVIT